MKSHLQSCPDGDSIDTNSSVDSIDEYKESSCHRWSIIS
jgi:hypothetical protein